MILNSFSRVMNMGFSVLPPPPRNTMHDLREKYCKGKSLYSSLFINCGGMETVVEKIQYDGDNATSNFYIDRNAKWAYLCSGDFLSESANSSDYKRNTTFGIFDTEAPLYKNARYCPLSLSYYGFCLMRGNYTVKLHFVENIYANDDDHSSSGERIFDVYIQDLSRPS
ncbi:hypothetical protein GH714_029422 [Hevea brasiliensis]|uniref:Malectin domain-containing protein n=1 Tax=Hevea brasiliensis TaxID=3981 RepID=A0A6A6N4Q3_HEVBR|nr:hypothetical protein GH714_029422 [Hevea brasiliensis]